MTEKISSAGEPWVSYEVFDVPSDWCEQEASRLGGLLERMQLGINYRQADFVRADGWHELTDDDREVCEVKTEPTFTLLALRQMVISAIGNQFSGKELQPGVVRPIGDGTGTAIGMVPEEHELGSVFLRSRQHGSGPASIREAVPALPFDDALMATSDSLPDTQYWTFRTLITVLPPESRTHARLGILVGRDQFVLPALHHGATQSFKLTPHVKDWARVSGTPIL